jgi:hypothetical protein
VRELAAEQHADGSWGAFHSRSTNTNQKIPSTEVGVARAFALGLDATHPILQNARAYIVSMMKGARAFPDYHEKMIAGKPGCACFSRPRSRSFNPITRCSTRIENCGAKSRSARFNRGDIARRMKSRRTPH